MALQPQNLPMFFGQGIDTKTDSKAVAVGKLLELENGLFEKRSKIVKRRGREALGRVNIEDGSVIEGGKKLLSYSDELLQVANDTLYSYSAPNAAWVEKGAVSAVT